MEGGLKMKLLFRHLIHMGETILPRVSFRNAALHDVLTFLNDAVRGCPQCSPEHPVFRIGDDVLQTNQKTISCGYAYVHILFLIEMVRLMSGCEIVFDGQGFTWRDRQNVETDPLLKPIHFDFRVVRREKDSDRASELKNAIRQMEYMHETEAMKFNFNHPFLAGDPFQNVPLGSLLIIINAMNEQLGKYDSKPPVYFELDRKLWGLEFGERFVYNEDTKKWSLYEGEEDWNTPYLGSPRRADMDMREGTLYELLQHVCEKFSLAMIFNGRMCLLLNRQHTGAAEPLFERFEFRVYVK